MNVQEDLICPRCGKTLSWSCHKETGTAFCEAYSSWVYPVVFERERDEARAERDKLSAELAAERAEVERLRAEVERLRAEVERRRDVYDLVGAVEHSAGQLAAHEDRGAWEERAAVVAYLHAEAWRMYEAGQDSPAWFVLCNRAEAIENSEHRREEKP